MKWAFILLIPVMALSGCSEDSAERRQKAPPYRNSLGTTSLPAAPPPDESHAPDRAPNEEYLKSLQSKIQQIGGGFHLYRADEIAEILNNAEFLEDSGGFIASYENYLAEVSNMDALIEALTPINDAPWKAQFTRRIFTRSALVTPEHLSALEAVCKSDRELEMLGEGASVRIAKESIANQLQLAQAFLDASTSDPVSKQIVGASVTALMSSLPAEDLETWLLGLPPEIAGAGDSALLLRYAENEPDAGVAMLQKIVDLGQSSRSAAAIENFGSRYAEADPQHALEWANHIPDPFSHARRQTLISAFWKLVKLDPSHATEMLQTIIDPAAKKHMEGILARVYSK